MKTTALVPAYNEERYIYDVLVTLTRCSLVDEIICVNDGSTDDTLTQIRKVKNIEIINLKKNHGKGYAIAKGIEKSLGDIILFIDADLQFLNEKHIYQLIEPLRSHQYDASLGYPTFNKSRLAKKIDIVLRSITGERAYFKKDLVPLLNQIKKKGYGLELYLNYFFKHKNTVVFPLKGLKHYQKYEKQSIDTVAKLQVIEGFDILFELINQKTQTIPLSIKEYFSRLYFNESPQIQTKINSVLKKIKNMLINSI